MRPCVAEISMTAGRDAEHTRRKISNQLLGHRIGELVVTRILLVLVVVPNGPSRLTSSIVSVVVITV